MNRLDRRQFIALGLSATAASIAGCSSPESSDPAPYTEWLPASDGGTVTAYIDFTLSADASRINPALPLIIPSSGRDDEPVVPTLSNLDAIDDPLLTIPIRMGGRLLGGAVFTLAVVGLGKAVDPARPAKGVTELFFADGVTVGVGDLDPDGIDTRLRTSSDTIQFERTGTDGEYTLYSPVEGSDGFVAISETAVVVADSRDRVETVLETRRGNRTHAAAGDDAFAALLDETNTGHMLVGWEGPVDLSTYTFGDVDGALADGVVSQRDDVVSSVTFDPDAGELTTDLAFRDADGVNAAALKDRLGTASAAESLSIDGNHVTASGTYTQRTVGLDFGADEDSSTTTTVSGGDDLPPEIANAVPENAFGFTLLESKGMVRVTFRAEFDADRVTIKATKSGYESSTTTPGPISYLNVSVNPENDVVIVIVTIDGVSGVVARYELP